MSKFFNYFPVQGARKTREHEDWDGGKRSKDDDFILPPPPQFKESIYLRFLGDELFYVNNFISDLICYL